MSQIFGAFSPDRKNASLLTRRLLFAHTGKRGYSSDRPLFDGALAGATRGSLSLNDEVSVLLDGAIFNLQDLLAGGETGTTESAEILVALFRRFGAQELLSSLNGEFSLVIHDARENCLWLARDHVGTKPLYYAETDQGFFFSSRLQALAAQPEIPLELNKRFVAVYAGSHYRMLDDALDETPFAHIRAVPPGCLICLRPGREPETYRHWGLENQGMVSGSMEEVAEEYRNLLQQAVSCRITGVEDLAFTLSGGMDSSSVLSNAVEVTGQRQEAFSVTYEDPEFNESDEIQDVRKVKVTEWHNLYLDNEVDLFSTVSDMLTLHEEPMVTATWLSHHALCKQAAESGFKTLLGGLGGDELNAGEYEYFPYHFADLAQAGRQSDLENEIRWWVRFHDHPIFRKDRDRAFHLINHLTDPDNPGRCLADLERLRRYTGTVHPDYYPLADLRPTMESPFDSYLLNRCYQDLTRETTSPSLRIQERFSAGFGLDFLNPFLDKRLIELMFRVPGDWKIRDGQTKTILRHAMKGILPEATRTRVVKRGWNAPAHIWFNRDTIGALREGMSAKSFLETGIYDQAQVNSLFDRHLEIVEKGLTEENHMMFLWQTLNLYLWIDQQVFGSLPSLRRQVAELPC